MGKLDSIGFEAHGAGRLSLCKENFAARCIVRFKGEWLRFTELATHFEYVTYLRKMASFYIFCFG
jgi:hypothetical protein